jgi:Fic family protein
MPLQVPVEEFRQLVRIIKGSPDGCSVGELLALPDLGIKKRTLQRRLDQLVGEGKILSKGEGRGRRYLRTESMPQLSRWSRDTALGEDDRFRGNLLREEPGDHAWLSDEARSIRAVVEQPRAKRTPVGYQGAFLDAYLPNRTFYLPETLRKQLAEMGQVGLTDLPAGTYVRQVLDRLLIDLSWNSSRLEGNTYSLLETQRLLEQGEDAEGKATEETQMILNHKAAIEMLADQAEGIGFNRYTLCNLHALLSDNLLSDPAACGRIRSRPVGIGGTVFHPLEVPSQIEERFEQIMAKAEAVKDPFEQAFFVMVQLPYLQPFEDVNKRVSRLAANIPMIRHNLCPLSFTDVEQKDYVNGIIGVYELNRVEYLRDVFVWAYRRSCVRYAAVRQSLGEPDPFRLRHRSAIAKMVREVVLARMNKTKAVRWILEETEKEIPETSRAKFVEVVETELRSLHEGNIARYRLRPSEFAAWQAAWK